MPASTAAATPDRTPARDGRNERAERTRQAVADALLALIREGELRPSAARIAERAGVSLRAVFHHYDDLEALFGAVADAQFVRVSNEARPVPAVGPLPQRIAAFVSERARVHESIAPLRRSAVLVEPFSPEIGRRLRGVRADARAEVGRVFALEFRAMPVRERADALDAVAVAASWSTWESLRTHYGRSVAQSRRIVTRLITALLEGT